MLRILPVPVVFLRLAFSPQLSDVEGQTCLRYLRLAMKGTSALTFPSLSSGIATRGAGVFLDMEGSTT